jgi:hypothetical protein
MSEECACARPAEHHLHLCVLKASLSKAELAELTKNPKYVCANCSGRTHSGRNLCLPKRLQR